MNLFIDANIFLTFYHLSGPDIEELEKLLALIDTNKVSIYLPAQLRMEVERNRSAKIVDAMKEFKNSGVKIKFPVFCKQYPEYEKLKKLTREVSELHNALYAKSMDDVSNFALKADGLIAKLFEKAKLIETNGAIFEQAYQRFRSGNPPGKKKDTFGDEINWEALLAGVPDGQDLFFISADSDYSNQLDENQLNDFLLREWQTRKSSKIRYYRFLQDFFKEKIPHIKLADEIRKESLIGDLVKSASFYDTHNAIARLRDMEAFTPGQVNDMMNAAFDNKQIFWISSDEDIVGFYEKLNGRYGETLSGAAKDAFARVFRSDGEAAAKPES